MSRTTAAGGPTPFYGARLTLPARDEEAAVIAFWETGCLGVEVVSTARNPRNPRLTLHAYFPGQRPRVALEASPGPAPRRARSARRRPPRVVPGAERRCAGSWE